VLADVDNELVGIALKEAEFEAVAVAVAVAEL
jgi:hypothetical protein